MKFLFSFISVFLVREIKLNENENAVLATGWNKITFTLVIFDFISVNIYLKQHVLVLVYYNNLVIYYYNLFQYKTAFVLYKASGL